MVTDGVTADVVDEVALEAFRGWYREHTGKMLTRSNAGKAIAAYLAALSPPIKAGEAVPVAWILPQRLDDPFQFTAYRVRSVAEAQSDGIKAIPLYASPQPEAYGVRVGTQATIDVLAERRRQVDAEGWTPDHDDKHRVGQLADAAARYATAAAGTFPDNRTAFLWPWAASLWKPSDARRNLVKAGALILAEIERLDRAALSHTEQGETP